MADLNFPDGFLWGAATAPVQNEGSFPGSAWWTWEQRPGAIRNGDRSGVGCDWWRNAEADFDLARRLGLNALRLGVEWSRIEPSAGRFDDAALARYRAMLRALRARGIEPMVTLHHFNDPLWFILAGGWYGRDAPAIFARFAGRVVEALGDLATLWVTINEPLVYLRDAYLDGTRPPGYRGMPATLRAARGLFKAHAAAYRAIHEHAPGAQVGIANHILLFDPADPGRAADRRGAALLDWLFNGWQLAAQTSGRLLPPYGLGATRHEPLIDSADFLGLNYYSRVKVRYAPGARDAIGLWRLDEVDPSVDRFDAGADGFMGEIYPEGIYRAVQRLAPFGKPIYITENGIADRADRLRPRFIVEHLRQVHRAIQAGADVRGYFHWTLVDNFEWTEGWQQRFGLVELDPQTQARRPRPSAEVYGEICRENGLKDRAK